MLYNILFYLFICVISSKVCLCERRITNGRVVATDKKYMVYLVNSRYSDSQPEAWLCGGVLISTLHVLTAAACLTEVSHIYVIAGYKKYVSGKNILDDPCTATRKQRIVKVIIPEVYNESIWMRFDVGVGVVEKHYDFFDGSYRKDCSYTPEAIPINYYSTLESAGDSVLALGWGAPSPRTPGMVAVNSEYLMETHAIIGNSSFCKLQFPKNLEYLFLCTYGFRDIETMKAIAKIKKAKEMTSSSTTKGTTRRIISSTTTKTSTTMTESTLINTATKSFIRSTWRCGEDKHFSLNNTPEECFDMNSDVEVFRRKALDLNGSDTSSDEISNENKTLKGNESDSKHTISRRQGTDVENYGGICQNDHGGALVAVAGQQERLIGIALNSVYNKNYQCDGPSLYISTARAKDLINCLLASQNEKYYVPKRCKAMNFEVRKYNVTWPDCEDIDCETTTWMTRPKAAEASLYVSPVPQVQTVLPTTVVQPNYNMELPPLTTSPNFMMGLPPLTTPPPNFMMGLPPLTTPPPNFMMGLPPLTTPPPNLMMGLPPYILPNQNIPLPYSHYPPQNYKMPMPIPIPYHYPYFTQTPYNMERYKLKKYHKRMGPLHIPSNLNMGLRYNPSNYD